MICVEVVVGIVNGDLRFRGVGGVYWFVFYYFLIVMMCVVGWDDNIVCVVSWLVGWLVCYVINFL